MSRNILKIKNLSLISLAVIMLAANILACVVPGQNPLGSDTPQPIPIDQNENGSSGSGNVENNGGDPKPGLQIRLSDGQEVPDPIERLVPVVGTPLTQEEIDAILERLSTWQVDQALGVDFRLPDEILPPPLTGETIPHSFPTQTELSGPQPVFAENLEVLRFAPEGQVAIAPFISVTFNQPMIALNTLESLAEKDVPVQVTPIIPGSWRWLGTRTLNFLSDSEYYDRLPMATEYLVTIPAGVVSASGEALEKTVQFSFSTPPPIMENYYPSYSPQASGPAVFYIL